ncbi:hypothetical protein [Mucilaginibacter sp. SP1R1]|uniref:hypothetical protein n=1 Tax=Mucilaginibacter sp. SP1R1 TaxID=2723091 RepID=UPI00161E3587|nr:hypothetical protein [Mucilaginibacter sp. SP1R1]MBB6152282.1 hypothetical protein [Mucilaginibacter sp. SP1R1]
MIITHETTVEQYEEWLSTNPEFTALKVAVRSVFRITYQWIGRAKRIFKKGKTRSSLRPSIALTVYPLSYNKNGGLTSINYYNWLYHIHKELKLTTGHLRRIEMFECLEGMPWAAAVYENRNERIARIEAELAMEKLHESALEVLLNR